MQLTTEQFFTVITIGLGVVSAVGGAIAYLFNRPQARASTHKTLTETVQMLSARLSQLEMEREADHQRILKLEAENHAQRQQAQLFERLLSLCVIGLQALSNQLMRAEINPEWTPPAELDMWMTDYLKKH